MALLTMIVSFDGKTDEPRRVDRMLKIAEKMLKLVRAIEKEHARAAGKKWKPIQWDVRLLSFSDRYVIELDAPYKTDPLQRRIAEEMAKTPAAAFGETEVTRPASPASGGEP